MATTTSNQPDRAERNWRQTLANSCRRTSNANKKVRWLAPAVAVVLGIVTISLLASSYGDLDYNEFGFAKNRISGSVDTSIVYKSGRHWLGPSYTLKPFTASAHLVDFVGESVFNFEKFEVKISCSMQYFLIVDDLKLLHDKYDVDYAPILRQLLLAAIKNRIANFTVDEYRLKRSLIENEVHVAAQVALGGTCCLPDCTGRYKCVPNCLKRSLCRAEDKGAFAEVRYFQLKSIEFSSIELYARFLHQTTLLEKQDTEMFIQDEKVFLKETELRRQAILVAAEETKQNATAIAKKIKDLAKIEAYRIVEEARTEGLSNLYFTLNMSFVHHKNALDYVRTMYNQPKLELYLGFDSMVAKSRP